MKVGCEELGGAALVDFDMGVRRILDQRLDIAGADGKLVRHGMADYTPRT
jgi:hypothetical protein